MRTAPLGVNLLRLAPLRLAPPRSAPLSLAPQRSALQRLTSHSWAPQRSASGRLTSRRDAHGINTCFRSALQRKALSRFMSLASRERGLNGSLFLLVYPTGKWKDFLEDNNQCLAECGSGDLHWGEFLEDANKQPRDRKLGDNIARRSPCRLC